MGRQGVVNLQAGDPTSRTIWQLLCDISRLEFKKIYDRLQIRLKEYGESYYNTMIPNVIEELESYGLLQQQDGALMMFCGERHNIPLIVRKSDGGFGYDSTDLAAVRHRICDLACDRVIYITDSGQGDHFQLIFDGARLAKWVNFQPSNAANIEFTNDIEGNDKGVVFLNKDLISRPRTVQLAHIGFGVVTGEDGKRLKTRSGETVRLVDLLDEAVVRLEKALRERIAEGKSSIEESEIHGVAEKLGYGAVKYFDLRQNPTSDYQFSYDRMLDPKGDTAVYLQFAFDRLSSILRKADDTKGIKIEQLIQEVEIDPQEPPEMNLILEILQFPEIIKDVYEKLSPAFICGFIYSLASKATDFLEKCFVMHEDCMIRNSRLLLVHIARLTMERCFDLLGITPVGLI